MGSDGLIDGYEAGKLLGISKQQVYALVRTGMLRPQYTREKGLNKPLLFHPEEISAVAEVRSKKGLSVHQIAGQAARAYAVSRQLERRVELLESFLGRKSWPLDMCEEGVISLYAQAQDAQQSPPTDIGGVMEWARIFIAMGEEYLDLTEAFTGDENCWEVYKNLADIMVIATPFDRLSFDKELEAAYGYLNVGSRNLRATSFFYIRNRFGRREAQRSIESEDVHEEVLSLAGALW